MIFPENQQRVLARLIELDISLIYLLLFILGYCISFLDLLLHGRFKLFNDSILYLQNHIIFILTFLYLLVIWLSLLRYLLDVTKYLLSLLLFLLSQLINLISSLPAILKDHLHDRSLFLWTHVFILNLLQTRLELHILDL